MYGAAAAEGVFHLVKYSSTSNVVINNPNAGDSTLCSSNMSDWPVPDQSKHPESFPGFSGFSVNRRAKTRKHS